MCRCYPYLVLSLRVGATEVYWAGQTFQEFYAAAMWMVRSDIEVDSEWTIKEKEREEFWPLIGSIVSFYSHNVVVSESVCGILDIDVVSAENLNSHTT